jgi:hypothetical protein
MPHQSRQVRLLKALVIGLGVLLVAGLLLVAGTIAYRLARMSSGEAPEAAIPATLLADGRRLLPAGASVRSISLDGNRLAINYTSPAGDGVVVIDLRSGAEVARIAIDPQK